MENDLSRKFRFGTTDVPGKLRSASRSHVAVEAFLPPGEMRRSFLGANAYFEPAELEVNISETPF